MTAAVDELKVRARVRLNTARRAGQAAGQLRDRLHEVAREAGFRDWEHARRVLAGEASPGDDMGTFWHAPRCHSLINEWHADLARAQAALDAGRYLLPYRLQFMVVQADFIRELGLDPAVAAWGEAGYDLVRGYGSPAWAALCADRLRAPANTFTHG
jgi:hypothetical protein